MTSAHADVAAAITGEMHPAIRIATLHQVTMITGEQTIMTREGPVVGHRGDALVSGVLGEQWPVPASDFAQRYELVTGSEDGRAPLYRRKPQRCDVMEITTASASIEDTAGTWLTGRPRDFVVADSLGTRIVAREAFARCFVWNRSGLTGHQDPIARYEQFEQDFALAGRREAAVRFGARILGVVYRGFGGLLQCAPVRALCRIGAGLHVASGGGHDALSDTSAMPDLPPRQDTSSVPGSPSDPAQDHDRAFANRVDELGVRYANLHRGGIVAVHLLGALAVTLAVLPYALLGASQSASMLTIGSIEAGVLVAILWLYRAALGWRVRWLDYRALAEGMRHMHLGDSRPVVPGAPWWQVVLASRRSREAEHATSMQERASQLSLAIRLQYRYHRNSAESAAVLIRSGHLLSAALFALSAAGCLLHLVYHWHVLLLMTAALPAWSAGIHGIIGALELEAIAASSEATARRLLDLDAHVAALRAPDVPDASGTATAVEDIVAEFRVIVEGEFEAWRRDRERRQPPLA